MPEFGAIEAVPPTESPQAVIGARQISSEKPGISEVVFVFAILMAWTALLAIGMLVNSAPYRDALAQGKSSPLNYLIAGFISFMSYTFTNLAMLSGLASLAGAGARHVEAQLNGAQPIANILALYTSAALRGFFVYLVSLSGLMFLVEGVFTNIAKSADIYLRLAGSISLLSFMLGFNPEMFARLLDRIARLLEDQGGKT
jgi:hypothetical protein